MSNSASTFHQIEDNHPLCYWLKESAAQGASDLFISVGESPTFKIYGIFKKMTDQIIDQKTLEEFIKKALPENKLKEFSEGKDVDLGLEIKDVARFRINIFRDHKGVSLAVRPLPNKIPTLSELGLPEIFHDLTSLKHGLILITGPAGSGKTTTLASFINAINLNEGRNIITIEDPIEYLIPNKRSLIHQREVGLDTASFADGLRSALREDPDVIVVGELRDLDSISLALRAAETGHLVLGTLHSGTAVQALTRIVDIFDSVRQAEVMVQLAQSLQCICTQSLIKRKDMPGMVLATEVLIATMAISNLIRQNRVHEIRGYMETGRAEKMHTLKQSIAELIKSGKIEKEQSSEIREILNAKI
jgi:twitching motility protein PilT